MYYYNYSFSEISRNVPGNFWKPFSAIYQKYFSENFQKSPVFSDSNRHVRQSLALHQSLKDMLDIAGRCKVHLRNVLGH
eukprot:UN00318